MWQRSELADILCPHSGGEYKPELRGVRVKCLEKARWKSLGLKRGLFDAELLQHDNGEKVFAEKWFQQELLKTQRRN